MTGPGAPPDAPGFLPIMRPWIGPEEAEAASAAIASGWVAQGPRVEAFERAIAERVGTSEGVAVSSCTTALHLALVILGVGPGDEVVVPSLSFIATANSVRYVGAAPVFADVEAATQNLTPATIAAVLTPATKAVIVVHQCGVPADMRAIHELADRRGVAVVEDAACAIGSTYRGQPIGGHSDLVAFSFHPRKVITTGEGGMLMTTRPEWAQRLRRLREHGMSASAADRHATGTLAIEQYTETGFNYRMTDIQAAMGMVQLQRLDAIVERRRHLSKRYQQLLAGLGRLEVVDDPAHGTTTFQSFWTVLPDDFPVTRNELMARMQSAGIATRRGIMATHLEPAFAGHPHGELPVTERLSRQSILLPLFHEMTEDDQDRVVAVVREAAGTPSHGR
jgi:dTDP-4-amino-4,6-dideoxygalactose transaminase